MDVIKVNVGSPRDGMTGTVVDGNSSVRGTPRNGMKGTAVEGEHRALG